MTIRFCKDCKFFRTMSKLAYVEGRCTSPMSVEHQIVSLVSGHVTHPEASAMRADIVMLGKPRCGTDARWFAPNEEEGSVSASRSTWDRMHTWLRGD
jgi:hypothetical protein